MSRNREPAKSSTEGGNGMQAMGSNAVAERRRVEAVVETLAAIHNTGRASWKWLTTPETW